jgi:NAD(P)-dependent dehydrogenase (short-subunit alcohol dehydrogenase family)
MEPETHNAIVISGGRAIGFGIVDELAANGLPMVINDRSDSAERDATRRATED